MRGKDGKYCCQRALTIQLGNATGDCLPVRLAVARLSGCGPKPEELTGKQGIHTETVTGMVLSGPQPEPCCAEVMVSGPKVLTAPVALAPACCPANCQPRRPALGCLTMPAPPPPPAPVGKPAPPPPVCAPPAPPVAVNRWIVAPPRPMQQPMVTGPSLEYVPFIAPPGVNWVPAPLPEPVPFPPFNPNQPNMVFATRSLPPNAMRRSLPRPGPETDHPSHVCVVRESGKSRLAMAKDDCCSLSVRMSLEAPQIGVLQFAAGAKYVHVSGRMWKASADEVDMYPDGRVILTGHVKIVSDKAGVATALKANHVCLHVKDGKVKKVDGGMFSNR
jgi:hypothetical protein